MGEGPPTLVGDRGGVGVATLDGEASSRQAGQQVGHLCGVEAEGFGTRGRRGATRDGGEIRKNREFPGDKSRSGGDAASGASAGADRGRVESFSVVLGR